MSMFLFTACPSSGDDEIDPGTEQSTSDSKPLPVAEELKPFIGFWTAIGTKYPNYEMFMFQDKKCWVRKSSNNGSYSEYGGGEYGWKFCDWIYNGNTTLLSISNNFQCMISLIESETWMGLTVGDNQPISYTAKRERDFHKTKINDDLEFIMFGTWQNVSNSEETFFCSSGGNPRLSYDGKSYFAPCSPARQSEEDYKFEVEYDEASDKMTVISSGAPWADRKGNIYLVTKYNIEIIHPYDYEHVYLIMDAALMTESSEGIIRSYLKGTFKRKI